MSALLLTATSDNSAVIHWVQSVNNGITWTVRADLDTLTGQRTATCIVTDATRTHVIIKVNAINLFYSSDSGQTFVALSVGTYGLDFIRWVNGQFVGFSDNSNDQYFYSSPTGAPGTWTRQGHTYYNPTDIGFVGGKYLFASTSSLHPGPQESTDLLTWSESVMNGGNGLFNETYSQPDAKLYSSPDGGKLVAFPTSNTAPSQYTSVLLTNPAGPSASLLTAVNTSAGGDFTSPTGDDSLCLAVSGNGVHWVDLVAQTDGEVNFLGSENYITVGMSFYNGTYYLAARNNGGIGWQLWESTDGKTWTQVYADPTLNGSPLVALPGPALPQPFWTQFLGATEYD